jgi:hypothetical protein
VIELLLAIIAASLLFGGAATLGFLETAFWLILFLAVAVIVVLAVRAVVRVVGFLVEGVLKGVLEIIYAADERLSRRFVDWWRRDKPPRPPEIKIPLDVNKARLDEWDDWIAQRREQRSEQTSDAQGGRAGSGEREAARRQEYTRADFEDAWACYLRVRELPPQTVPVGNWRRDIGNDDIANDVANSVRRLLAPSVLSLPKGEFAERAGRPLPPEIATLVQILLRERPDLRDYILDELRWKGWRVEGF